MSRKWISILAVVVTVIFLAFFATLKKEKNMNEMPSYLKAFNVQDPVPACAKWRDHMPEKRDPEVYRIYIHARKLWRSKKPWQFSRDELLAILRDVKIAADAGDWGAKSLLSHFYLNGLGPLDSNNVLPKQPENAVLLAREAVKSGQPWGYYDLGVAHEHGYGGAILNNAIAWAYYLKAAKLGSPDGQMALAGAYRAAGKPENEMIMVRCASAQGHGAAFHSLALDAAIEGRVEEALRLFQDGVKYGNKDCAATLFLKFGNEKSLGQDFLSEISVEFDLERKHRYKAIVDVLELNPDLKFGRLDEALPLPPASLPKWQGIEAVLTLEPEGAPTY